MNSWTAADPELGGRAPVVTLHAQLANDNGGNAPNAHPTTAYSLWARLLDLTCPNLPLMVSLTARVDVAKRATNTKMD